MMERRITKFLICCFIFGILLKIFVAEINYYLFYLYSEAVQVENIMLKEDSQQPSILRSICILCLILSVHVIEKVSFVAFFNPFGLYWLIICVLWLTLRQFWIFHSFKQVKQESYAIYSADVVMWFIFVFNTENDFFYTFIFWIFNH